MANKLAGLLVESLQDSAADILRIYGFERLLARFRSPAGIDERIAKLTQVQEDLEAAIEAVRVLRRNADDSRQEAEQLRASLADLHEEKMAAEEMARLPEEAVARLLFRANAKGRGRGLLEGIIGGFVTGFLSSLLVWYLTTPSAPNQTQEANEPTQSAPATP